MPNQSQPQQQQTLTRRTHAVRAVATWIVLAALVLLGVGVCLYPVHTPTGWVLP